jgi:hypothetical protein
MVDSHVVIVAESATATVLTADPDDMRRLSAAVDKPVPIVTI